MYYMYSLNLEHNSLSSFSGLVHLNNLKVTTISSYIYVCIHLLPICISNWLLLILMCVVIDVLCVCV